MSVYIHVKTTQSVRGSARGWGGTGDPSGRGWTGGSLRRVCVGVVVWNEGPLRPSVFYLDLSTDFLLSPPSLCLRLSFSSL